MSELSPERLIDLTDITSVRGFLVNPDRRFSILQRAEISQGNPGKWELVGGKQKHGETKNEALVREIKGETGRDVTYVGMFEYASQREIKDAGKYNGRIIATYFAVEPIEVGDDSIALSDHHQDNVWTDFEGARRYALTLDSRRAIWLARQTLKAIA